MEALGLTFLPAYVWGRAAALGEPEPDVVVATFGVFEPSFLRGIYAEARAAASRADVLAAREAGTVESLHTILDGVDAGPAAESLRSAVTEVDGSARPLFS